MADSAADERLRKELRPRALTPDAALSLAKKHFGNVFEDTGDATVERELDSYDDRNYLLTTGSGARFVLKVHNGADSRPHNAAFLEAQNAALQHLAAHAVAAPVPQPAADGAYLAFELLPHPSGTDTQVRHGVRLLSFVEGRLMSEVPHSQALLADLGRFVGEMDQTFKTFDHPAAHRTHLWDLANLLDLRVFVECITSPEKQALANWVLERYETEVAPVLGDLPQQTTQNDANDHNIVVDTSGNAVAGIIDFGDMVHTARVNELAICIAYALLDKDDLGQTAAAIATAYTLVIPLIKSERRLLHTLVASRLCQSVIMSSYSFSKDPSNTYLLVTAKPGWVALERLMAMSVEEIAAFNAHAPVQDSD